MHMSFHIMIFKDKEGRCTYSHIKNRIVKFMYSEKATNFFEIFTLLLSYVVLVKSKVKISQNLVAFSEYMNFTHSCIDLQNRNPTQPRIKQEGQNFLREPALISRVSSPFSPSFVATFYMESYSG